MSMNSPFAYIGGKSRLAKQIISIIPEHKTYVEAFSGAAWIFFKKQPSRVEVINDLDSELITFYRVVQHHLEEFLKQFKWLLTSREVFLDYNAQLKTKRGLTDIQKAARYYYVQRMAFGGKVRNRTYGVQIDRPAPRINLLRIEEEMSAVHLRLAHVRIENLPALELIKRYDRPDTFFCCDPPYHGHPDYKHNMSAKDYEKIAGILSSLQGRFILSINDHPEMRKVFKSFNVKSVSLLYSVGKKPKKARELIISN